MWVPKLALYSNLSICASEVLCDWQTLIKGGLHALHADKPPAHCRLGSPLRLTLLCWCVEAYAFFLPRSPAATFYPGHYPRLHRS